MHPQTATWQPPAGQRCSASARLGTQASPSPVAQQRRGASPSPGPAHASAAPGVASSPGTGPGTARSPAPAASPLVGPQSAAAGALSPAAAVTPPAQRIAPVAVSRSPAATSGTPPAAPRPSSPPRASGSQAAGGRPAPRKIAPTPITAAATQKEFVSASAVGASAGTLNGTVQPQLPSSPLAAAAAAGDKPGPEGEHARGGPRKIAPTPIAAASAQREFVLAGATPGDAAWPRLAAASPSQQQVGTDGVDETAS